MIITINEKTQQFDSTLSISSMKLALKQDKYWCNFPSATIEAISDVVWHTVWTVLNMKNQQTTTMNAAIIKFRFQTDIYLSVGNLL